MNNFGMHVVITALLGGCGTALILSVPQGFMGVAIGTTVTVSYFLGHYLRG